MRQEYGSRRRVAFRVVAKNSCGDQPWDVLRSIHNISQLFDILLFQTRCRARAQRLRAATDVKSPRIARAKSRMAARFEWFLARRACNTPEFCTQNVGPLLSAQNVGNATPKAVTTSERCAVASAKHTCAKLNIRRAPCAFEQNAALGTSQNSVRRRKQTMPANQAAISNCC